MRFNPWGGGVLVTAVMARHQCSALWVHKLRSMPVSVIKFSSSAVDGIGSRYIACHIDFMDDNKRCIRPDAGNEHSHSLPPLANDRSSL